MFFFLLLCMLNRGRHFIDRRPPAGGINKTIHSGRWCSFVVGPRSAAGGRAVSVYISQSFPQSAPDQSSCGSDFDAPWLEITFDVRRAEISHFSPSGATPKRNCSLSQPCSRSTCSANASILIVFSFHKLPARTV